MTAIIQEEILPHRTDILRALKPCKFHKTKPVREAALETIKLLKETEPPLDESELAELEDKPLKSSRQSKSPLRGSI